MSLACWMASSLGLGVLGGTLGVSGLHVPAAVRVANDIAVVRFGMVDAPWLVIPCAPSPASPEEIHGSVRVGRLQYWNY